MGALAHKQIEPEPSLQMLERAVSVVMGEPRL